MTYIAIAGDVHGEISLLYEKIAEQQKKIETPIEAIFQVGEFPIWFREKRTIPIPTYAILGNHDDAELFYRYAGKEILPSLHLLQQGRVVTVKIGGIDLRIGTVGGNYSPKFFKTDPEKLPQGRKKHYTKGHIDSIVDNAPVDILLTHEAPRGFIVKRGGDVGRPEISDLIEKSQPKLAFFGHHHQYVTATIGKTIVTGLAGIYRPEGLILVEVNNDSFVNKLQI